MAHQHPGGGETIIHELYAELQKTGVDVTYFDPWTTRIADFDLVHHFSLSDWPLWRDYKTYAKKVVLTPTSWPWPDGGLALKMKEKALDLLRCTLQKETIAFSRRSYFRYIDHLVPTTESEVKLLASFYDINPTKMTVVTNGVRPFTHVDDGTALFYNTYKKKDFLLFIGSIAPHKNVDLLIRVAKENKLALVIIGEPSLSCMGYLAHCKDLATGADVDFLGRVTHDNPLFAGAINNSAVVCVPSDVETCSLVGLEAATLNKPIVITNKGGTKDVFKEWVYYVAPKDEADLALQIKRAIGKPSEQLKSHVLKNHDWTLLAEQMLSVYKKTLKE